MSSSPTLLFFFFICLSYLLSLCSTHEVLWAGGVTDTEAHFRAIGLQGSVFTVTTVSPDGLILLVNETVETSVESFKAGNLTPGQTYYYAAGGESGQFKTFYPGRHPFKVGFGSCTSTPSLANTWSFLESHSPDLFIVTGDLFYYDIEVNDTSLYSKAYQTVFDSEPVRKFFHKTPIAYIWDDHDYGTTDGDASPSKDAARESYHTHVPHYPLSSSYSSITDTPIYQAFTVNDVRFILTDLRSESIKGSSIISDTQLEWFLKELSRFEDYSLMVWVSSRPWISGPDPEKDRWGSYPTTQSTISDFISSQGVDNLVMLAGDAHMLAIDDGSNSDYRTNHTTMHGAGFPVFVAAPLDRPGSTKGGPYSLGCYTYLGTWNEQFGIMEVYYPDSNLTCLTWSGYRTDYLPSLAEALVVTYSTCVPTVKPGVGGTGTCKVEFLPLKDWLLLGLSYSFGLVLLIAWAVAMVRMNGKEKKGHLRRVGEGVVLLVFYLMTVVVVIVMLLKKIFSHPYRPAFLPVDIGWVVVTIDVFLCALFLAEFVFVKRSPFEEDHELYLKLKE